MSTSDDNKTDPTVDPIVKEAHERAKFALDWENKAHGLFDADIRFANADADNGDQWDEKERDSRDAERRPRLTVNKVRQHNLSIVNDARQNKPAIKYMATGGGATYKAAQVWSALARHIEYISNAQDAYDAAVNFMVNGGWGYVRVITEYESDNSFSQRIRIVGVKDPKKVLLDPAAQERDKSDSRFGFIFEDVPRKEFIRRFPKYENVVKKGNFEEVEGWITQEFVRTAEYYRVVEKQRTLAEILLGSEVKNVILEDYPKDIVEEWRKNGNILRERETSLRQVEWYYILGNEIVEDNIWPGKYIPIVPFIAEEVVIDGKMDRKSHTRAMKDPQRMYNWYASTAVEYGAIQTKHPWVAPLQAIDGIESEWNDANRVNKAVLVYNAFDEDGNALPPPQRTQPPISAPLAMEGMAKASEEMEMVSGQFAAQMGAPSNERSGRAITERQRQGDRATYHYIDAAACAIRCIGRIILDTVPRLYEASQVLAIVGETGEATNVKIDPEAKEAYQEQRNENEELVLQVLNPLIGEYAVQADVGPGYATRREETFNALILLLTQAPQLAGVIGDLLFRSGDFMYAEEAAERLRRMVPPQALGQGPTPNEQQLMAQVDKLKQLLSKMMDQHAQAQVRLRGKDEKRDIEIYRAFTERLKVLEASKTTDENHAIAVAQLMRDIMNDNLEPTQQAVNEGLGYDDRDEVQEQLGFGLESPPVANARKADDGHWYVPDLMRKGKYMRVLPQGTHDGWK